MRLGTRKVRSAGRTSGSVEITLPVEVQALTGIGCEIILQDGVQPQIVLQPDLSVAQALFIELWGMLRRGLEAVDDVGDFALSDFNVALLPPRHWYERPPLSYNDALILQGYIEQKAPSARIQNSAALLHLITFLAINASYRLGLKGQLTIAFGDALGYLVTGASGGHGSEFERDAALAAYGAGQRPVAGQIAALSIDDDWTAAQEGLRRVYELFATWQADPAEYEAARNRWWQSGVIVERGAMLSTVEAYLRHGEALR
ncbi:MAG: hypothetical protein ISS50_06630 [Anaerolineae bacterium]|nr:hypothetical protein [Anaerolineae bacterium]